MTKISRLLKKKYEKYIIIIFIIISVFLLFYFSTFIVKPEIYKIPYSTIIYDKNSTRIGEIITDNKYRHELLSFSEIPEFTKNIIIALEDKSFFLNSGIDFKAIIRAFINNYKAGDFIEGGSTISTQVIRNNYWLNEKRTILLKLKEFYLSLCLNHRYEKEEILANYLGNIYFGYLNYGIKSASNYYFAKDLNNLTKAEQIALISLPKNPSKFDPYKNKQQFKTRFKNISDYLLKNNVITNVEYDSIINEKLVFNYNHKDKLPYIVDYLKNFVIPAKAGIYNKGHNQFNDSGTSPEGQYYNNIISTTIDYNQTKKIEELAKNSIIPLMWKNVKDYSIIIIDRETNTLSTMIGGIDYYGNNGQVSMATSPRQVGSTIKPFTYLLAFKNLGYTPNTTITDLPVQFQTDLGYAYNPKNYSLDYKGEVTIAEALSQSINIPALKVAEKVGVGNILNFLKTLGITSLTKDENYYGLALTLGVGEISLFEITRAFSIFANDGKLCEINVIARNEAIQKTGNNIETRLFRKNSEGQSSCKQIIEKKYTDMINEILTNRYYKINAFPINGNLDFPDKNVFLKTGTSRNFKDNWTIGYTDNYIIGVWAGNKDGSEMKGVSGASGAGEIFKTIVDYLEKDNYTSKIKKIEKQDINYLEITSPLNNSKYEINTNKPKETQKIKLEFSTNLAYDKYKWFINEKEINNDFYSLEIGQKEIKIVLYDNNGKTIKEENSWIYVE